MIRENRKQTDKKENIIELGYRPKDRLDSSKPPKGGSAVSYPPKSSAPQKPVKHH